MSAVNTVGLVVVSHSMALARAAVALAQEMVHGKQLRIAIAAGLDDTTFGTDATQIVEAITSADQGAGVVVLMDLGSAVLSAELALDLLEDDARARVVLCPAPLVEGLVVAAVAAASGASVADVVAEAGGALAGKIGHLGLSPTSAADATPAEVDALVGSFTVANPHGLHARPAARLVQEVRRRDARAYVRKVGTDSTWVDAGSLSKIATLGVRSGDMVEIRISGGQAAETLEHVLALAARNFDESSGPAAPAATTEPVSRHPIGASPGLGIGPARSARLGPIEVPDAPAEDPSTEWRRMGKAIAGVRRTISQIRTRTAREIGEAEAVIFDAHQLLLDDAELLDGVRRRIDDGASAPAAWAATIDGLAEEFAGLADPYLRERAADVRAVGDQVMRAMIGAASAGATRSGVLITDDLTPAEAADLQPAQVTAVLMAFGSPHAHNVILLRAKGIPAVVGVGQSVLAIPDGTVVAVDGTRGEFLVDPPVAVEQEFRDRVTALARRQDAAKARASAPAVTLDGLAVGVGANVGSVDDARAAAANGADFAGLVRTEFLFLGRPDAPGVDEQVAVYRKIAESLDGRRVTLRTLDVGGDKPLEFLPGPAEVNPFLGVRGIRLSLHHPDLLSDQLLAMALVARDTPVSIMFPMISTLDELLTARRLLDQVIASSGRGQPDGLQVGMMIEVPAAALKSAVFAQNVDFLSIGTNDLTQYALAADRSNQAVATIGDTFDPGLLQLIRATCAGAAGHASVSVCGEFAADERVAGLLLGLGVDALSVTPPAIPAVKEAVRAVSQGPAMLLAERTLAAESAQAVRTMLGESVFGMAGGKG